MSVLFISEPQPFMPVYNPLNFVFYSLDHGTEADFKYIVDVNVNGVFVSQHEVYNTNVGQARFDCSEVVKARLTSSILALSQITTDYFNSICEYQITVTEFYNGATHDSETSTELRAFNGSLRTDTWLQWDWNEYTLNSDSTDLKKFLTDFPRSDKMFVRSTDSCYIGMLSDSTITNINVFLYDISGTQIDYTQLTAEMFSDLFVINPNVEMIKVFGFPLVDFDNCYYYEVEIAGLLSTTERFRFYIDRECERYPSVRLVWLNKYGVWDAYTFKLDSISESDIKTIMHESTLGQWEDLGYNYAIANGQHLTHLKEVTDRLILNSDWIKPSVQNWLVRSLYESPLVYIESVDFTQQESETCDTISVTYTLVGGEPVTVEVERFETNLEYFIFDFIDNFSLQIVFDNIDSWRVIYQSELQAFFYSESDCPFGEYTIEEGSIFEAFEVNGVMLTVPAWSYEPLNVVNELSRQKTSKRDMLIQEQVTAKRTFDYKSQIL